MAKKGRIFEFGGFTLTEHDRILTGEGRAPEVLASQPFHFLLWLLERPGEVVKYSEFYEKYAALELEPRADGRQTKEKDSVPRLAGIVRQVRTALGDKGRHSGFIETAQGVGYKFAEPVRSSVRALASHTPPTNLLADVTSFIGRAEETHQVIRLLTDPTCRLVTLSGAGGVGKSRLAINVGRAVLLHFPDGVFRIDLAPLHVAGSVLEAVKHELRREKVNGGGPSARLDSLLRNQDILLILDNFDRLVDDAGTVIELLGRHAGLKILATSRTLLGVQAERVYDVPPLPVPSIRIDHSPLEIEKFAAGRLFVERARQAHRDFALDQVNAADVAWICRKLEGIPLALELAAARVLTLSVLDIRERLSRRHGFRDLLGRPASDKPERQQTMWATMDWSRSLLSDRGKGALALLSVFRGAYSEDAAETICATASGDFGTSARAIDELVSSSLLQAFTGPDGRGKVRMLEVVREYAGDYLEEERDAERARYHHAYLYLNRILPDDDAPPLAGPDDQSWIAAEYENVRTALDWFCEFDPPSALKLAYAIRHVFFAGRLVDGQRSVERALAGGQEASGPLRVRALLLAGELARGCGRFEESRAHFTSALSTARDGKDICVAKLSLGVLATCVGDLDEALDRFEGGRAFALTSGDVRLQVNCLFCLADLARLKSEWGDARNLLLEAQPFVAGLGEVHVECGLLVNLAACDVNLGSHRAARSGFRDALALATIHGHMPLILVALLGISTLAVREEAWDTAASLFGFIRGRLGDTTFRFDPAEAKAYEQLSADLRSRASSGVDRPPGEADRPGLEDVLALARHYADHETKHP